MFVRDKNQSKLFFSFFPISETRKWATTDPRFCWPMKTSKKYPTTQDVSQLIFVLTRVRNLGKGRLLLLSWILAYSVSTDRWKHQRNICQSFDYYIEEDKKSGKRQGLIVIELNRNFGVFCNLLGEGHNLGSD